jgi:glycine cleavage system H protein
MAVPPELRYSKEHEWVRVEGDGATMGITDHAQEQLGDIVYLDLPKVGASVRQSEKLGEIESVKAVSDLFSPMSGEVAARNEDVVKAPELVNQDPYGRGWLLKLTLSNAGEVDKLLTAGHTRSYRSGAGIVGERRGEASRQGVRAVPPFF